MIKKIKLKHLPIVIKDDLDIIEVVSFLDVDFGSVFGRNKRIAAFIEELLPVLNKIRGTDPTEAQEVSDCLIKRPERVDDIPFSAMIEIRSFLDGLDDDFPMERMIAETIAMVCFSSNYKHDFATDSNFYNEFVVKIMNQPILDMFGLFHWIEKSLSESEKKWSALFNAVRTDDVDYMEAGGDMMDKFNVIETVKNLCQDFNIPIKEAWQLPYSLTQANSLAKATKGLVQENLINVKERKIKQSRRNP